MNFYVGIDDVHHVRHFPRAFVSVNRLRARKSDFVAHDWIMDSGAFTELSTHGTYRSDPEEYAKQIERWRTCGNLECAVTQDWMCEPWIVAKTGLSVERHQALTIERFDRIRSATTATVMPVLQGFTPREYLQHLEAYGERVTIGMRMGVGSICKRQSHPALIEHILRLIKAERPDLRLHGFGVKITALARTNIRSLLFSADSMAWSFNARKNGRNAHDWREAAAFVERIERMPCLAHDLLN